MHVAALILAVLITGQCSNPLEGGIHDDSFQFEHKSTCMQSTFKIRNQITNQHTIKDLVVAWPEAGCFTTMKPLGSWSNSLTYLQKVKPNLTTQLSYGDGGKKTKAGIYEQDEDSSEMETDRPKKITSEISLRDETGEARCTIRLTSEIHDDDFVRYRFEYVGISKSVIWFEPSKESNALFEAFSWENAKLPPDSLANFKTLGRQLVKHDISNEDEVRLFYSVPQNGKEPVIGQLRSKSPPKLSRVFLFTSNGKEIITTGYLTLFVPVNP